MSNHQALEYLQEEQFEKFNTLVQAAGGQVDLSGVHLRSHNLRKCNLTKANLAGAYMRSADLRGLDLSEANLEGATIKEARVSGALFPRDLSAQEIQMSLKYGTRLRHGL